VATTVLSSRWPGSFVSATEGSAAVAPRRFTCGCSSACVGLFFRREVAPKYFEAARRRIASRTTVIICGHLSKLVPRIATGGPARRDGHGPDADAMPDPGRTRTIATVLAKQR
jgi:hypothetical protein